MRPEIFGDEPEDVGALLFGMKSDGQGKAKNKEKTDHAHSMTKNAAPTQERICVRLRLIILEANLYCIIFCALEMMRSSSVSANLSGCSGLDQYMSERNAS